VFHRNIFPITLGLLAAAVTVLVIYVCLATKKRKPNLVNGWIPAALVMFLGSFIVFPGTFAVIQKGESLEAYKGWSISFCIPYTQKVDYFYDFSTDETLGFEMDSKIVSWKADSKLAIMKEMEESDFLQMFIKAGSKEEWHKKVEELFVSKVKDYICKHLIARDDPPIELVFELPSDSLATLGCRPGIVTLSNRTLRKKGED